MITGQCRTEERAATQTDLMATSKSSERSLQYEEPISDVSTDASISLRQHWPAGRTTDIRRDQLRVHAGRETARQTLDQHALAIRRLARFERLVDMDAPSVILRNEWRLIEAALGSHARLQGPSVRSVAKRYELPAGSSA